METLAIVRFSHMLYPVYLQWTSSFSLCVHQSWGCLHWGSFPCSPWYNPFGFMASKGHQKVSPKQWSAEDKHHQLLQNIKPLEVMFKFHHATLTNRKKHNWLAKQFLKYHSFTFGRNSQSRLWDLISVMSISRDKPQLNICIPSTFLPYC